MSTAPSPLQELADAARASDNFMINAEFELPRGKVLTVTAYSYRGMPGGKAHVVINESSGKQVVGKPGVSGKDLGDALRLIAADYPKAVLRPKALKLHIRNGPVTSAKFKPMVVQAWHEAFGLPIPSPQDLAKQRKAARDAGKAAAEDVVALLKGGPSGVARFNRLPGADRAATDLRRADLSGCDLTGVKFNAARLDGADFSGSTLAGAEFYRRVGHGYFHCSLLKGRLAGADLTGADLMWTRCGESDFRGAKLSGAKLMSVSSPGADFTGAVLAKADVRHAYLAGVSFRKADLTDADFRLSNVKGADFSGATLSGVQFEGSAFDEKTRWPRGYKIPADLRWKGAGPDPRLATTKKEKKLPKPTDFAGFLERLRNVTDAAKLAKAMSMLQAERFQLFAKVTADHLVGVVKSQSSRDLVYACRLGADGKYACCTQNLNVCGGLRGSPCKHLLVLVVGLARAGALDPATAHDWSQAARGRKAELDRDAMTETFLQYKGAEAGEVDWRPTETIPEDFYAV
jgi:uncharacterized protein YjbI with pentapeptide repeats